MLSGFYYRSTSYKGQPFSGPLLDLFQQDSIDSNPNFFQNFVSSSVAELSQQQISTTDRLHPSFYDGRPPFEFHPSSCESRTSTAGSLLQTHTAGGLLRISTPDPRRASTMGQAPPARSLLRASTIRNLHPSFHDS